MFKKTILFVVVCFGVAVWGTNLVRAQSTNNITSCNATSCEGFIDYLTSDPTSSLLWIRLANVGVPGFGQYVPGNCSLNGGRYIYFDAGLAGGNLMLSQIITAYSTQQKVYYGLEADSNGWCRVNVIVLGNY